MEIAQSYNESGISGTVHEAIKCILNESIIWKQHLMHMV